MLYLEDYGICYPDGLKLHYGDIHVRKGELAGLFGPSGCGKTSLLESILNPDFPGRISFRTALLDGEPLPKPGPELYRRVSYCPQFCQAALNPKLTLREHIHLTCDGNRMREDKEEICRLMSALHLEESVLSRRPGGLSGGQQQRMVLLLCALKKPCLMILDEPSSAIDLITLKDMVFFLREIKENGTAILMVSHSYAFLERAADHIIDLREGNSC